MSVIPAVLTHQKYCDIRVIQGMVDFSCFICDMCEHIHQISYFYWLFLAQKFVDFLFEFWRQLFNYVFLHDVNLFLDVLYLKKCLTAQELFETFNLHVFIGNLLYFNLTIFSSIFSGSGRWVCLSTRRTRASLRPLPKFGVVRRSCRSRRSKFGHTHPKAWLSTFT